MSTLGCLIGKTKSEKRRFFKSLYSFKKIDPQFYKEQVADLLPSEKAEYRIWKDNRRYKPRPRHWIFTLHWWNPFTIIGLILAPFWVFFFQGCCAFGESCRDIWDGFFKWDWS
jgi:hypothetical protein